MLAEELLRLDVPKYASQALSKPWFPLPKVDPACSVMVDCQDMFLVHFFDFRLMPSLREERGVERVKNALGTFCITGTILYQNAIRHW